MSEIGFVERFKRLIKPLSGTEKHNEEVLVETLKVNEKPGLTDPAVARESVDAWTKNDKDASKPLPPINPPEETEDEKLARLKRETAPDSSTAPTEPLKPVVVEEQKKTHPEVSTLSPEQLAADTQRRLRERWKSGVTNKLIGEVVNTPHVDTKPVSPFIETEELKNEAPKPVEEKPLPPMSTVDIDTKKAYGAY